MTLQTELEVRLDGTSFVSGLAAELGDATDDLRSVSLAVSAEDVAGASGMAGSIDLSGLSQAIEAVTSELGRVASDLPVAGDLIGPIRAGIDAIGAVVSGDLETQVRGALDRLAAEFDLADKTGALGALRGLAEGLRSAPEFAALRAAIDGLLGAAGGRALPVSSVGDLVSALLSALDAIGRMMALETALAEARRLGALVPAQLPEGRIPGLLAGLEAAVAAAEGQIETIDASDAAAVDAAIDALLAVRRAEVDLIEALRSGMAFGEATLALVDPAGLVARSEAVLEQLRGVAVGDIAAALGRTADQLAPALTPDLSGAPSFSLSALLDQLEARGQDLAAEVAGIDLGPVTQPFAEGLGTITAVVDDLEAAMDRIVATIEEALGRVRNAIASLPLDHIAAAIRDVVGSVAQVVSALGDVLGAAQEAIGDSAEAALAALARAEAAVDAFRNQLEAAFREAKRFVDGLGIETVMGQVADGLRSVSDLIAQADMAPYFATAQDAIDTTTDVIEKVPFPLLPDSMEQDVVDLIRPIKTADLAAFRQEILAVLQIGEDGTFTLRPELEAAVAGVQQKLDDLLAALREAHPQKLAGLIDEAIGTIRQEIESIAPRVDLGPVTEALDAAKAAVAALDLDAVLQPLGDGFDAVLAEIDRFQPGALVAPLDTEIDALRQKFLDLARLEEWRYRLDAARAEALALVELIDAAQLETALRDAFAEMRRRIGEGRVPDLLAPLGAVVGALLAGGGTPVAPEAFERVVAWLRGQMGGGTQLATLTDQLRAAIAETRRVVAAIDPGTIQATVGADTARLSALVDALPAGAGRVRLATAVGALDVTAELRTIGPNHQRYLDVLSRSEAAAARLATKGFGEVDAVAAVLRAGFSPLLPLIDAPREVLRRLGFTRFSDGLPGMLEELFEVATPGRLAGILTPVLAALRGRAEALLDGAIQPLRDLITALIDVVNTFDLDRLTGALDGVHATIRAEIAAFHPDALLGAARSAFDGAKTSIAAFDPLGPVSDTLATLKATILRVLAKLDGDALLATPIEIYETILGMIEALELAALLDPLLDRIDAIAVQVSDGLEGTVESFERLQEALPAQVGSTSVGASVSVGG